VTPLSRKCYLFQTTDEATVNHVESANTNKHSNGQTWATESQLKDNTFLIQVTIEHFAASFGYRRVRSNDSNGYIASTSGVAKLTLITQE
jgi:hypothetical protein